MAENDSNNSPYNDSEYTLKIEAQVVAKEIAYAVKSVEISNVLPSTNSLVYLNLETKDNQKYCVSLSDQGFRIIGNDFNEIDDFNTSRYFETIYSLLDHVSLEYRNSFGDALLSRLQSLKDQQLQSEREILN